MGSAFSIYGLVYLAGFILFTLLPSKSPLPFTLRLNNAIYAAIGAIIGGRLGYVFFYEPSYYINHISEIYKLYLGGMSFHGGAIGLILALYLLNLKDKKCLLHMLDRVCICALFILPLGRIVNFINGELWGVPTSLPIGVIFEGIDHTPRHAVQLYEAITDGPVVALILWFLVRSYKRLDKNMPKGVIATVWLLSYSVLRFLVDFLREPDLVIGYVFFDCISMGQVLCVCTFILSLICIKRLAD